MAMCEVPECQEHYGCRLRNKGIQLSNSVTPSRTKNMRPTVSVPDSSKAAVVYDERPGGIKVPIMKADGSVLRDGEARRDRAAITSKIRSLRSTS